MFHKRTVCRSEGLICIGGLEKRFCRPEQRECMASALSYITIDHASMLDDKSQITQ